MGMIKTVPGIYDGQVVRLLEPVEFKNTCRVTVTFAGPTVQPEARQNRLDRFIGMWADLTPEEEAALQGVMEERAGYFTGRNGIGGGEG